MTEVLTMDDPGIDDPSIDARTFEDATKTVVKTLGSNFKCDVVFSGSGAKTDGKTVYLPVNDPTKQMTKKQYAVGQGYANHETLHNLCTDFKEFQSRNEAFKKEGKKLSMMVSQAVEDVRIEHAGKQLYPGIPRQIDSTTDYVCKEFMEKILPENPEIVNNFKAIGALAITWAGRKKLGYVSPYQEKCLATLPEDIRKKVESFADAVLTLETGAEGIGNLDRKKSYKGCADGIEMASRIAQEIEECDDDESEAPDDGEGGGGSKDGERDPRESGSEKEEHDPLDVDLSKCVYNLLDAGGAGFNYKPFTREWDTIVTADGRDTIAKDTMAHPNNLSEYEKTVSQIGGKLAVMRRKLERALMIAQQEDYVSGQRVGKVDVRRRGVQIMKGHENVFRKRLDGKNIDTAVMILVDASGSMNGEKMQLAAKVTIALSEALAPTSVPFEVLAFNTEWPSETACPTVNLLQRKLDLELSGNIPDEKGNALRDERGNPIKVPPDKIPKYHRVDPVTLYLAKPFDKPLKQSRQGMGGLGRCAGSSNADADSVLYAYDRLMKRKEKNKIMLVLSDGKPAHAYRHGCPGEYLTKVIKHIDKEGDVKLVGIGILDSSVKRFYPRYEVVTDLATLDKSVLDNVARMILGERFRVDNGDLMKVEGALDRKRA